MFLQKSVIMIIMDSADITKQKMGAHMVYILETPVRQVQIAVIKCVISRRDTRVFENGIRYKATAR